MKNLLKYSLLTAFAITAWNCSSDSAGDDLGGSTFGTTPSDSTDDAKITKATVKLTDLQKDNLKGKVEKIEEKVAGTTTTTLYNEAGFLLSDKFERTNYLSERTILYNPDNFIISNKKVKKSEQSTSTRTITAEYDDKNIMKAYAFKNGDVTISLSYTFDDAKKTLTGTNGKTGNDRREQIFKFDDKLNTLEQIQTFYSSSGQEFVVTSKYDTNGLAIEYESVEKRFKTEYNNHFQPTKKTITNKLNAKYNSTTVNEYNSNGHLAKKTITGSVVSTDTYMYILDAQKNWTTRTKTDRNGNKEVTTRVITYKQ